MQKCLKTKNMVIKSTLISKRHYIKIFPNCINNTRLKYFFSTVVNVFYNAFCMINF